MEMAGPTLEEARRAYAALLGPMTPELVRAEIEKLRQEVQAWRAAHRAK
jgi:hypothetical protein